MSEIVFFDLDGTLTDVHSPWQYIHERLGLWTGLGEIHLAEWRAGLIDYKTWFDLDVEMWRGFDRSALLGILDSIGFRPGVKTLLRGLKSASIPAVIISSGFTHVARRLETSASFRFAEIHANEMVFGPSGKLLGVRLGVSGEKDGARSKSAILRGTCARLGIDPAESLAVGDSASDTPMFQAAGFSIGLVREGSIGAKAHMDPSSLGKVMDYV